MAMTGNDDGDGDGGVFGNEDFDDGDGFGVDLDDDLTMHSITGTSWQTGALTSTSSKKHFT